MKEVKITIPDNCELIKEGNSYIVREKDSKPRTWEEFCKNYPITEEETYIYTNSSILNALNARAGDKVRYTIGDKNLCTSQEEAEAFLALMQLRQLRKAWVGDWEQSKNEKCAVILWSKYDNKVCINYDSFWCYCTLAFPTIKMAKEFLECFRDLCEQAKSLL